MGVINQKRSTDDGENIPTLPGWRTVQNFRQWTRPSLAHLGGQHHARNKREGGELGSGASRTCKLCVTGSRESSFWRQSLKSKFTFRRTDPVLRFTTGWEQIRTYKHSDHHGGDNMNGHRQYTSALIQSDSGSQWADAITTVGNCEHIHLSSSMLVKLTLPVQNTHK